MPSAPSATPPDLPAGDREADSETARPRRATFNVDLGALRPAAEQRAQERGVRLSAWLREVVAQELASPGAAGVGAPSVEPSSAKDARVVLDPASAAVLDGLVARGGFRTRAAAVRALVGGVDLAGAAQLAGAVEALARSNHQLVAIARMLQRVETTLKGRAGGAMAADQLTLREAERGVREHVRQASQLLAVLMPALRPRRDKEG